MVDEHLNWKGHINIIENKLSKNLGLFTQSKTIFKYKSNDVFLFFIHS